MEKTEQPTKRNTSIKPVLRLFGRFSQTELGWGIVAFGTLIAGYALNLVPPLFYKHFFDVLADNSGSTTESRVPILIGILGSIALVYVGVWVSWRINEFANARFEVRVMTKLTNAAFENLLFHSYAFFNNSFSGSLVRKITRLSRSFEQFKDILIYNILPTGILLTGVPFILAKRSPLLGIGFFVFSVLLILFHVSIANWKQKYNLAATEKDTAQTGTISDSISNQHTVKLFAGENRELHRIAEASGALAKARLLSIDMSTLINVFQSAFMFATEIILMYIAIRLWERGIITVGDFALIQAYLISAANQLWGFNKTIRNLYEAIADASEMVEIMETPYEVRNIPTAEKLMVSDAEITFDDVTFAFNETRTVLDHFNLTIKGGERIALVGPSGAGKSTIVKLLLRLHDVTDGKIKIDGTNIKDATQASLREVIGFVPQEPILFHRSLLDNIRYGKPDATEAEVIEASKQAHCHEFIKEFPEGYKTFVGERGVKLSGGERQRVAIARAILKNAPILILDEATSSLDSESEQYIQEALETLMKGKTVMVIAHRLSTIMRMDRIVVIEDGVVADEGTHNELLKKDGLYKKLWSIQAGGFMGEE